MFRKTNMNWGMGLKNQYLCINGGACLNKISGPVTVKHQLQHLGDVFRKYRMDKANVLGEINSKNRGILSGKKKVHTIIIHFAVAANENANVVGERFSADDSNNIGTVGRNNGGGGWDSCLPCSLHPS